MAIEDRNLKTGAALVARYKKRDYHGEVKEVEGRQYIYVQELDAGTPGSGLYKSVSAAGSGVMGGNACNGWKFWSLAQNGDTGAQETPTEAPARPKGFKLIRRVANQKGVEEGRVRYFCSACMKGFVAPAGEQPTTCPEGHGVEDPELLAVVGA